MRDRYCAMCGSLLKEYVGLNGKAGEGEMLCPKSCVVSDGVPEPIDWEVTPKLNFSGDAPFLDLGFDLSDIDDEDD